MRAAPHLHATVDAVVQAAVVAGWFGLTYLLAEVIFGSSIPIDANSRVNWLGIAAVTVYYPVWTLLAIAISAQTICGLVDRRRRPVPE